MILSRLRLFQFLFLLIFVGPIAQASHSLRGQAALIYHGPGSCQGCPEAVAHVLRKMGFQIKYVVPGQLNANTFSHAVLYVQPGGSDDIEDTLKALQPDEIQNIRQFVSQGGRYLGICAGAYLAGQSSGGQAPMESFGLIPIQTLNEELSSEKATLLSVDWLGQQRFLYFQGGPHFGQRPFAGARVIAHYEQTGRIAALISNYGKGHVGLVGPHAEANEAWFQDDDLDLSHGPNYDLLVDFVHRLFD